MWSSLRNSPTPTSARENHGKGDDDNDDDNAVMIESNLNVIDAHKASDIVNEENVDMYKNRNNGNDCINIKSSNDEDNNDIIINTRKENSNAECTPTDKFAFSLLMNMALSNNENVETLNKDITTITTNNDNNDNNDDDDEEEISEINDGKEKIYILL